MPNMNIPPRAVERFSEKGGETQEAFDAKLQKNREIGWEVLSSGEWQPFDGFDFEVFNNLEVAALVLSEESKKELIDRVVTPLATLAEKYGISAIYTGIEDQEPHITLDVSKLDFKDPDRKTAVIEQLHGPDSRLSLLGNAMVNSEFNLDKLVIQPPNIYICSSEVDLAQIYPRKFRDLIENIWGRIGAKHKEHGNFTQLYASFADIFHISTARLVDNDVSSEEMKKFAKEAYETVGKQLEKDPITIKTDVVRFINAAEDVQREEFNREAQGKSLKTPLLKGAPSEWVDKQRTKLEENNEPYLNRPSVIV